MKRHSLTTSILGLALFFLSAQAQAGLFTSQDFYANQRKHMGTVSEIISNGISAKDVKVSISPGERVGYSMRVQIAIELKGQRACIATSSFESMTIVRSGSQGRFPIRSGGGYKDTYSCANIDGISVINTEIEAMRVDSPDAIGSKTDAGDGYLLLTVMLDRKPSIFRIDSPYFKKAALSQDPLNIR